MLENALSEDYKPNLLRSSSDLEEDQGLELENNHEGRRSIESVPLISYVSPRYIISTEIKEYTAITSG